MRKKFTVIILLIVMLLCNGAAFAAPPVISDSCSYILIDAKTGQVILEYNADKKLRPASTTKIMTAILALEKGNLNDVMNISEKAVNDIGDGGMNIGIMPGESNLTLENLLNAMLVKSANETANIIAENIGGSIGSFVEMMNNKAAELGAVNTHFVNPCGKDDAKEDAEHLTTARDLSIIARYAMTIPKFREIVAQEYYRGMPATDKHQKWDDLHTSNKLLWYNNTYPYTLNNIKYYFTVNGIKTGYTSAAGNNLVSSATGEDGTELIAVVMHSVENNKIFEYTKQLLRYGLENYSMQSVTEANRVVKSIVVGGAKDGGNLDLLTASGLKCALPLDYQGDVVPKENIKSQIDAPVKKGDVLGYIEYERNGVSLGKVNVIASRTVEKNVAVKEVIKEKTKNVFGNTVFRVVSIIVLLSLGLVILRIILLKVSRKRYKRTFKW